MIPARAIYYHRDILIEQGLIQPVGKRVVSKRYEIYYARVAKTYVMNDDDDTTDIKTSSINASYLKEKIQKYLDLKSKKRWQS